MKYSFPKVDLHFHLDGSMVPETTWRLAKERGIKLPTETLEEFKKYLYVTANCNDVAQYLSRFALPVSILQDKAALKETTYDTIEMIANQGVRYCEIRFAPQLHIEKGLTQADAIDAVLEGVEAAAGKFPKTKVNIILCAMLNPTNANRELNLETARLSNEYYGKGVVALDLAGWELAYPMKAYEELFAERRKLGLPITIHAGDDGTPENVSTVIDFGASRVGHGHKTWFDKDVLNKVKANDVALEICLTSNIQCKTEPSYAEHPAKKLYDAGVKVTLNTDNTILSAVNLDDEYDHAINDCGFTYNDLIKMNINSVNASFATQEEKKLLIAELNNFLSN